MIIFYKLYSNISLALIWIIMVHYLTIFFFSCNWTARLTMSLNNTDELIIMIFRLLEKHGMLHVQLPLWECISWSFRIHNFFVDVFNLYINTTTVLNLRSLEIYVSNSKLLSNFTEIIIVTLVSSSPFGRSSQVLVFLYPASVRLAFNTSTCGCTCQVKCECHCYWKRGLIAAIRFLNYRWETIDWSFNKTITAIKKSLRVKCLC